jgi:biotin-[acetyl-CoA-carboxylase] ligase BirA-like protein
VASTIDVAFEHMLKVSDTDTAVVVTATVQNQGRGRNNKLWFCGTDNLCYTFGIKHAVDKLPVFLLQVIGGLAVYRVLSALLVEDNLRLKYPNDIYAKRSNDNLKKISGIKTEHVFIQNDVCTSIIGIGINNKQTDFPDGLEAVSLMNMGIDIENDYLKEQLTNTILELIEMDREQVFDLWKAKLKLENKTIRVIDNINEIELDGNYKLEKILDDCRLLLVGEDGTERIIDNGDSIRYNLL